MQDDDLDAQVRNACASFADPHPRVRYAAINAVGQLSRDFAPSIQVCAGWPEMEVEISST